MTTPVVLDASAAIEFLVDAASVPEVIEVLGDEDGQAVVPYLCDVEIASALRSALHRGVLEEGRADEALSLYELLPLERVDHLPLLRRVLRLRGHFSAYDAVYVALAEVLGARLCTADRRLAAAARAWTDVPVVEV